jgi:hypothetical protein
MKRRRKQGKNSNLNQAVFFSQYLLESNMHTSRVAASIAIAITSRTAKTMIDS